MLGASAVTLLMAASESACYVHAFAGENYRAPMTTYTGPTHERFFMKDAKSLIVGPGARLVGYAGTQDAKQVLELPSDATIPDLAKIDFHSRVASFQVVCKGR